MEPQIRSSLVVIVLLFASLIATTTTASAAAALQVVQPSISCTDLAKTDLSTIGGAGSKITSASEVVKDSIAYCAVSGVLPPSIGFKVYLPLKTWTQRFLQIGCGGLCGNIPERAGAADDCVPLVSGGFVTAGTDMGHQGGGGTFARNLQKREDFAYRGVHLTALATKRLIKSFYGRDAAYSYFTGCSDGGREALMEAQRFPGDFDGIVAGAAAMNFEVQNSLYHGWQARSNTGPDGKAILTVAKLPLLHKAVLAACDKLDGQEDALISDPRICHFDPGVLLCKDTPAQSGANCLSQAEVAAVRRLYEGPTDPATGEHLTAGGPLPGSEMNWAGVFVPFDTNTKIPSENIALDAIKNLIFTTNPPDGFKLADLVFDKTTFDKLRAHHPLLDATNPDLSAFASKGGKLILWHGWADPHISPLNTIAYHEALERQMGNVAAAQFERLYLLPGVSHCSGGEGPSAVDLLTPMLHWVEDGTAPDAVIAKTAKPNGFGLPSSRPAGTPAPTSQSTGSQTKPPAIMPEAMPSQAAVQRTRPVYPYPAVAVYSGRGNVNDAENYRRGAPLTAETVPAWAGSDFYRPYIFLDR